MPHYISQKWLSTPDAYGPRRARSAFTYQTFVPDRIADLAQPLSLQTSAAVVAAEMRVAESERRLLA